MGKPGMTPGTLYYGDCLEWMERWEDECVDLIYLDPPFNSKTNYNILYSSTSAGDAQMRAFEDTWQWDEAAGERIARFEGAMANPLHDVVCGLFRILGPSGMMAYLSYMAERLLPTRRLLKPTGSIYLHCDPTASHYLKVLMDAIFGGGNFLNEVVWKRTGAHGRAKRWGPIHDTILLYSKSSTYTWNRTYEQYDEDYIDRYYRSSDERGRYQLVSLDGPGLRTGSSGQSWRGVNPSDKGRHWELPPDRSLPEDFVFPDGYSEMSCQERLDVLDAAGLIYWPPRGRVPRHKRYLSAADGNPIQDIISDIRPISSHAKERLGYPTQKPLALLKRIILASSNEGDMVLDPFCGCGTAIEAARQLNRRWVGIDISPFAIDLIRDRRLKDKKVPAEGIPSSLAAARMLAREKPFAFETWAVTRIPGFAPNQKKVADGGIDGRGKLADQPEDLDSRLALAQVKGTATFSASHFRDFMHVLNRDKAAVGCFLTLNPAPGSARAEAKRFGTLTVSGKRYDRLHTYSMEDYFSGLQPQLPAMLDPYTGKPVYQMALL